MSFQYFPVESLPEALDTVWCRFPYDENPYNPADVLHPTLVRQPLIDSLGRPHVIVIYGTSQDTDLSGEGYITISEDLGQCRLSKPTRYVLSREARVPWCQEYFNALPGKVPKIGRPTDKVIREIQTEIAYLQRRAAE